MKLLFLACAAALLSSCAPGEVLPDAPKHPTAVTRSYFHNLGFKGFFASESTRTVMTRADMRREENEFSFSGFMMKHLTSAREGVTIWRVDKNKQWRLDPKGKTYVECPLAGCPAPKTPERPSQPSQRQEEPPRKPTCPLTLSKNRLTVEATSESREINGFKAKLHKITWEVALQDKKKRKDTSLVTVDVWTTPEDDPRLRSVRAVESQFEQRVREHAPERSGVGKVIPPEAMKVIAMQFLSGLSADQRSAVTSAAQELGKIHGHPVKTELQWRLSGDACEDTQAQPQKKESGGLDLMHGVSGLLGSAAQKGVEHEVDAAASKPVFGFVEELQKSDVEPATDAYFTPPPSYTRKN